MPNHAPDMTIDAQSAIQRMAEANKRKEQAREVIIEKEDEWRSAINRILATNDGKLMAKYMVKYVGLYAVDNTVDAARLLEKRAQRNLWLELFRKYLDPDVLVLVENQR